MIVRTSVALIMAIALLAPPAGSEPPLPPVAALSWMAGYWVGVSGETTMEEFWLAPAAGMMVGLHRDVSGSKDVFFEFLRIEERDDSTFYIAKPSNQPSAEFRLVDGRAGLGLAIFENPDHDYPQRIRYDRVDNVLTVTISGTIEGEARSSTWVMKRTNFDKEMK